MKIKVLNKILKQILKVIVFLGISALLFWLVYRGQDVEHIKNVLQNDVNYWWIWLSLVLGLISHISRTFRWMMLIEPLGKRPGFINSFLAVLVGYLMNLAIPRMGEISRCGVLARYEQISFTKLVGTVVTERISDVIMMLLLTAFVAFAQFRQMLTFLKNNPEIKESIVNFSLSPIAIIILTLVIVFSLIFYKRIMNLKPMHKVKNTLKSFGEGVKTIKNMKNKWLFLFHTILIWFLYFMMIYVVFFAFDFTSHLSMMAGLTVFVMGAYGMVAPVQGGIGAWHFMVIQGLIVYGISKNDGLIFAFLAHSSMNAMIIVVGLMSVMALPFLNRKKHTEVAKVAESEEKQTIN